MATRIKRVVIENPDDGLPSLLAIEEIIVNVEGNKIKLPSENSGLFAVYQSDDVFPLRSPISDELLGTTMSQEELQVAVYSFCRQLQIDRDGGEVL